MGGCCLCVFQVLQACVVHTCCVCAELFDKGSGAVGGGGAAELGPQSASVDKDIDLATDKFIELRVEDKTVSDIVSEGRVSSKSDVFVAMATIPGAFSVWHHHSVNAVRNSAMLVSLDFADLHKIYHLF